MEPIATRVFSSRAPSGCRKTPVTTASHALWRSFGKVDQQEQVVGGAAGNGTWHAGCRCRHSRCDEGLGGHLGSPSLCDEPQARLGWWWSPPTWSRESSSPTRTARRSTTSFRVHGRRGIKTVVMAVVNCGSNCGVACDQKFFSGIADVLRSALCWGL